MSNAPQVPELLAPAGGREQFYAALNAGADAVYLGLKAFNARARADNFTPDDLRELVPLAHDYGMKVLVTVNVLVKDLELEALVATLATLEELEVDAIIVQDLAVARIARRHFPALRLHASTQMAVHNLAGVQAAQALGFKRVVLARELTAAELRRIRDAVPRDELELEAFCHGSLCYSYSGLCFFSGAEDARSGNRGECAYTCRQPYKIVSEPGHGFLFSMRDLDTSASLDQFVTAGVDTLKIEGRKKDAQYVASTVTLYRQRLDELFGRPTLRPSAPRAAGAYLAANADPEGDLALSFQRRRTSLFLKGRYHENVIDLDSPTHEGLVVGAVRRVRGRWLTVAAACELERFDGLRIVPAGRVSHRSPLDGPALSADPAAMAGAYANKHVEFSLRELRVGGQRASSAPAGAEVEIELPPDAAAPEPGDVVRKVRSADLKRRVFALAVPPEDARPRAVSLVDVTIEAREAGGELRLTARADKFGSAVCSTALSVPALRPKGAATLAQDAEAAFAVLGDYGFHATSVRFSGDANWFVPRGQLKTLKHQLGASLVEAYPRLLADRRDVALAETCTPVRPLQTAPAAARRFAVKSDRLETLRQAAAFAAANPEFALEELVLEPKRAFLTELAPEALAADVSQLARSAGVPVRLALPMVVRAWDEPLLKRWFAAAWRAGCRHAEVGNVGGLAMLRAWGLEGADVTGDFTLYALNAAATRLWREQGISRVCLSVEDDLTNLRAHVGRLDGIERAGLQAIVFKDTPLFIAEACSLTALHNGCPTAAVCGYRTLEIENQKGERFFVAHESCKSVVYGKDAYSLTHVQGELLAMGLTRLRVDFLTRAYSEADVARILGAALRQERLGSTHTANFARTLL